MRPPLLFIHGAFCQAAHFEPWLGYFQEAGYRGTSISLPGHGGAETEALARLTFADYVDAVMAAVRGCEQPPVVVGHSMGGLLAMRAAMQVPVAGLVVVNSPAPGGLLVRPGVILQELAQIRQILAGLPVTPSPQTVRALVTHHLSAAESDEILAEGSAESGRVLRRLVFGMTGIALARIACPVLCLAAGGDRVVPQSATSRIAKATGAEVVVFPGHGHWLIAGSLTGTVAATVRDWLERHF